MPRDKAPRPDFLFIGTAKSGSTWIYDALREHPGIYVPRAKDLQFFDYHYDFGMDWYLKNFELAGAGQVCGELSHDYYLSAETAQRIQKDLPDVRLICCLREPGDFARSTLQWWHSHTREFGKSLEEMAENRHFSRLLSYRENLERYFELFPAEQIHVVFYEQLKSDPARFIEDLYAFVGASTDFIPSVLHRASNVTRPARSRALLISAVAVAGLIRRAGGANLVGAVKSHPLIDRVFYRAANASHGRPDEELEGIIQAVRRRYAVEFDALAGLIGTPLPAEWGKAAALQ